ncbi:MAG: hypothetical protein JWP88_1126 [Flaviaesturariibacter sp.]|nr:hypothetical protein [Flaviaesturariibacter sp.]
MKNVYDLFMANYTAVIEKGEIESSINYYISEVEHSTLTNVEKEALIASFIVASQSPFYLLTK